MKTGLTYTSYTTVGESNTACAAGSGDLEVFATPAMAALMENAAMLAVAPALDESQTTVGSQIDTTHIRPSAVGAKVSATAVLTAVEGRKLTFSVSACDEQGVIGEGTHVRYIVDRAKFLAKLK
ncbi:MAG: thioesterase family protein [Alistipes sp.]